MLLIPSPNDNLCSSVMPANLPELQHGCGVQSGVDPADEVEVSHIQAAVPPTGQRHGGQQLVAFSQTTAAGARDTAPAPVPHDAVDDWRLLLWYKHVLPTALMQDPWNSRGIPIQNNILLDPKLYIYAMKRAREQRPSVTF